MTYFFIALSFVFFVAFILKAFHARSLEEQNQMQATRIFELTMKSDHWQQRALDAEDRLAEG